MQLEDCFLEENGWEVAREGRSFMKQSLFYENLVGYRMRSGEGRKLVRLYWENEKGEGGGGYLFADLRRKNRFSSVADICEGGGGGGRKHPVDGCNGAMDIPSVDILSLISQYLPPHPLHHHLISSVDCGHQGGGLGSTLNRGRKREGSNRYRGKFLRWKEGGQRFLVTKLRAGRKQQEQKDLSKAKILIQKRGEWF
jgi:hypothetical protein